jgi:hypothetical protein
MSIEAMKQALEALERLVDSAEWHDKAGYDAFNVGEKAITSLHQAIAEAEKQEPVPIGELSEFLDCEKCSHCQTVNEDRDNYCLLQRKVVYETCEKFSHWEGKPRPIYPPAAQPAQPKREWVGLTDEEIDEGQRQSWVDKQAFESAVWWAEAKLKEKNT